ncbi:MAG: HU family DNA-binding protein [Clostridia bacterium]|nr:HU family DNA-binding protein [Clostridia bacterium]
MNKSELVAAVVAAGVEKKAAAQAVDTVLTSIGDTLAKGESVALLGFGTFSVKDRPERKGHNPATGESITIAASKSVVFKAGKALKDKVK